MIDGFEVVKDGAWERANEKILDKCKAASRAAEGRDRERADAGSAPPMERVTLDEIGWLLVQYARSQPVPADRPLRLALVLSGGGAKCAYQVGAIQAVEEALEIVKKLYSKCWEKNWGFVPMTDKEIDHLAKQFKPFVKADMLLFDPATVGISPAERVADLPGGGRRTIRRPTGVHGVFCNGVMTFDGKDYVKHDKGPGQVLDRFNLSQGAHNTAMAAQ